MVILHIASIDNNRFNGVPRAVPAIINAQRETGEADIAFLNVRNIRIEGLDCQLFPGKLSLNELKYPFNRPDLVVFHEVYYPPFLKLAGECRKNYIPYVIVPHGCLTGEAQNIKKWKKRIGNELLFKRFVIESEGLQFLSASEKKRTVFNKEGFIGPNGIGLKTDYKRYDERSGESDKSMVFTYIGRIDPYIKGLDILIETVAGEQEFFRKNACSFAFYGPDPGGKKQEMEKLVEVLNVKDLVSISGPVDEGEKQSVLLNSDVFFQFSRSEALPSGILEALSFGVPCAVSHGTGLAGLINTYNAGWGETGTETLPKLLKKAVCERNAFPEKSLNARRLIKERFERGRCARRMIAGYQKMIGYCK